MIDARETSVAPSAGRCGTARRAAQCRLEASGAAGRPASGGVERHGRCTLPERTTHNTRGSYHDALPAGERRTSG